MRRKVYAGLGIIALASPVCIATASAGPCTREIAAFQSSLSRDNNGEPTFTGTLPQSIGAQLEHQPTQESVEHAKKQARAQILMFVTQAEALDSEGKKSECKNALATAKHLLDP